MYSCFTREFRYVFGASKHIVYNIYYTWRLYTYTVHNITIIIVIVITMRVSQVVHHNRYVDCYNNIIIIGYYSRRTSQ